MVNKNIIEEIITKSILSIKCTINRIGSNTLNNKIKGTLNRFAEKTKNNTIEQGLIIGNNGEELDLNDGTYEHVGYDEDEVRTALDKNNGKDLYFEHNHVGSFIDKENKFTASFAKPQLNMPTMLSLPDIQTLFEHMEYNGQECVPFKSITCDSTNGTRMTLTRIDKDGDDLYHNHVLNNLSDTKYDVNEAWKNMYSRWATFFNKYNKGVDSFAREWHAENMPFYMEQWAKEGKTEEARVRLFEKDFNIKFNKVIQDKRDEILKDYEKEVMTESIKEFKELGFELSMEWR